MLSRLYCFLRGSQKAITALLVAGALYLATRYQFHLPPGTELIITSFVTSVLVYLVPNQHCE